MKEIKYRAFIKHLKWIAPVISIYFEAKEIEVDFTGDGDIAEYSFDEVELIEFTNIKDVKNVEIYENAIVKVNWPKASDVGVVKWFGNGFYVMRMKNSSPIPLNSMKVSVEVIGNVYENPQLIN